MHAHDPLPPTPFASLTFLCGMLQGGKHGKLLKINTQYLTGRGGGWGGGRDILIDPGERKSLGMIGAPSKCKQQYETRPA